MADAHQQSSLEYKSSPHRCTVCTAGMAHLNQTWPMTSSNAADLVNLCTYSNNPCFFFHSVQEPVWRGIPLQSAGLMVSDTPERPHGLDRWVCKPQPGSEPRAMTVRMSRQLPDARLHRQGDCESLSPETAPGQVASNSTMYALELLAAAPMTSHGLHLFT